MSKRIVIAIDGPAGSGKSTVARAVADKLGFVYINTGAMYRAVALWAMRRGVSASDMHRLEQLAVSAQINFAAGASTVLLNGEDITEAIQAPEVAEMASKISAVPAVRRALVEKQRAMAFESSVVMEGRDIATVVCPDAEVKIFLDANPTIRADRRILELRGRGREVSVEATREEIAERDHRDRTRAESPLIQAPDASYVDTTALTPAQVEEIVLKLVREKTTNGKERAK